ncbi:hypothetical protein ACS0TY_020971 [Phlomoides rotata]
MAAQEIVELFCELIVVHLPIIEAQRQALYGYDPLAYEKRAKMTCDCWPRWCCCCCCAGSMKLNSKKKGLKALLGLGGLYSKKKNMMGKQYSRKSFVPAFDLKEIEEGLEGYDE